MRKLLFLLVLFFLSVSAVRSQPSEVPTETPTESVSWCFYYVQTNLNPKRIVERTCEDQNVTFYKEPKKGAFAKPSDICDQVIYFDSELYKTENTSEEGERTPSFFFSKRQGKTKFVVQVGIHIYTVYHEHQCLCPDPMCEAKHGHMQMCTTRYFTKEFGTLYRSDDLRTRPNSFFILEAENPTSDINALVYYILSNRVFSMQPDHQMLQLYLNR